MRTIEIHPDENTLHDLEQLAQARMSTIEALTEEAVLQYVRRTAAPPKTYSFIGIGHSGKGDVSSRVEETLAAGADRRRGWSLVE